ncbi:MAG: class I SAM-dependent methyltransferase, partial [Blastocatellia bacterium]|nr:class I SAM-dependent methyltransferase [Blastocatellia bacterium]
MPKDNAEKESLECESEALRQRYEEFGVAGYYARFGSEYRNPHEPIIREVLRAAFERWHLDLSHVLDLACGSGEVTLALRELGCERIDGIDPYTGAAFLARTGLEAEALDFERIAEGALAGRSYSLIVCSFALHLIEVSWLPSLLARLGAISQRLLIITPHKRPAIKSAWGWSI